MRIKRSDILKAIRNEPLKAGTWITEGEDGFDSKCKVCAVGAVLRTVGIKNDQILDKAYFLTNQGEISPDYFSQAHMVEITNGELKEKRYLNALSIKFEYLFPKLGNGKRMRKQLAEFVKKNFPKVIDTKYSQAQNWS